MIVTDSEAWRLWKDGKEKNIKTSIPLEEFVEQAEELIRLWVAEKPNINRSERLKLTLYRFRYAVSVAHAAKMFGIPERKAREFHQRVLCGVMSRVKYLATVHAGEQYEFHVFAVLNMLYERFEEQTATPQIFGETDIDCIADKV